MTRIIEQEIDTVAQLREMLVGCPGLSPDSSIAVEALIFDEYGRWILRERGQLAQDEVGKLEGIGGRVETNGNLRDELHREITEEIGTNAEVEIVAFLEIKTDRIHRLDNHQEFTDWVIVSYLCKHVAAKLQICEPRKN